MISCTINNWERIIEAEGAQARVFILTAIEYHSSVFLNCTQAMQRNAAVDKSRLSSSHGLLFIERYIIVEL